MKTKTTSTIRTTPLASYPVGTYSVTSALARLSKINSIQAALSSEIVGPNETGVSSGHTISF